MDRPQFRSGYRRATALRALTLGAALMLGATAARAVASDSTDATHANHAATLDLQREQRVATIGYRLASSAGAACRQREALIGVGLHDISSYAARYRATVRAAYDLSTGFGVRFVVKGSAAERAGIRGGDEIVALDGVDLAAFGQALITPDATPDRTAAFAERLDAALAERPAQLLLRHHGATRAVTLVADHGCGGHVTVAPEATRNAWSDGHAVAIGARLVDVVQSDDALAFVLAHEMAHNILRHAVRTRGRSPFLAEFGIGAGLIKQTEIDADALAIALMLRAGFAPDGAETMLRTLQRERGPSLAVTHPGTERRIRLLHAAATRVRASEALTVPVVRR